MSGLNLLTRYRGRALKGPRRTAWILASGIVLVVFGLAVIVVVLAWSAR